jgi:hypothetical protein
MFQFADHLLQPRHLMALILQLISNVRGGGLWEHRSASLLEYLEWNIPDIPWLQAQSVGRRPAPAPS